MLFRRVSSIEGGPRGVGCLLPADEAWRGDVTPAKARVAENVGRGPRGIIAAHRPFPATRVLFGGQQAWRRNLNIKLIIKRIVRDAAKNHGTLLK